ncbi:MULTISPECIES: GNAT family N-acetyltransferase [Aequorivita]|uniref:GNAT family N-acetyltransferase n=1 Tax=Aequorivita iocasae TaxID=2803865 RepID=A0ABX7DWD8_9FLAO|nr:MULTISPECIES: GNAT family N-acetyltransferase [Aequorivita]QQX77484.1 GNAT family N-acetyltransferase [Aequorivita iocasae]UCA56976.1 GNAT family N-acetyltransferase [Aequorivita sp. F7]
MEDNRKTGKTFQEIMMMKTSQKQNIRPALPEDFKKVAPLIVQAMEDLACTFANTDTPEKAYPLFEHFFQKKANQYSFEHTLVYVEDGEIVGSITFYDGKLLPHYRAPFLQYIAEFYKVTDILIDDETNPGEVYIDTLSVAPQHQGKGVGKKLLAAAIQQAKTEGHEKIGLLVDFKNPNAKKLYVSLGFESVGKKTLGSSVYEHLQRNCNLSL